MKVGNTVTVDRRELVDQGTGALSGYSYTIALSYADPDGRRDVTAPLDAEVGAVIFNVAEVTRKAHLGGRAIGLAAAAAEADALSKGGK